MSIKTVQAFELRAEDTFSWNGDKYIVSKPDDGTGHMVVWRIGKNLTPYEYKPVIHPVEENFNSYAEVSIQG